MIRHEIRVLSSQWKHNGALMYPGRWRFTWVLATGAGVWFLANVEAVT